MIGFLGIGLLNTEMKGFIYEKLLQKKPIYWLGAWWWKTLRTTTSRSLRTCGACMGETHWCHRRRCLHRHRRCCCCCRHHRCYDRCRRWRPRRLLKSTIHHAGILLSPSHHRWKCPWHFLPRNRRSHHPRSLHRLRPAP
jgi:hypothetical protein